MTNASEKETHDIDEKELGETTPTTVNEDKVIDTENGVTFRLDFPNGDEEYQRTRPRLIKQDSGVNQAFAHINILQTDINDYHPNETLIHEEINPFAVQYIDVVPTSEIHDEELIIPNVEEQNIYAEEGKQTTVYKFQRKPIISKIFEYLKYLYSGALLVFCVVLVNTGIIKRQTKMEIHPAGSFILFWFLIFWLAMMEGGQGCLVGLQPIEKSKYSKTHPIALKNTILSHKGDNMERFIVGRQFLVVLVVFLINMTGSPQSGVNPLDLPSSINSIFLDNGVALMITSIILGNLTSQVNAATCMLDFINNYFMLFTTYVSIGIEFSGLLHSVYLFQYGFAYLTKTRIISNEPPRSNLANAFFWIRVAVSSCLLCFCLAVTLEALFKGQSGIWDGTPEWASVIIFLVFLCIMGIMEGMQIAAFALLNIPDEELNKHGVAAANCLLMFEGSNLQAFLIGRQMFVASLMFIVAKIASISVDENESNILGVSDGFQKFLNTGLLGALVLTVIGSLAWRIIASAYPLAFMSNPLIYVIIRTCLFIERIGICACVMPLAKVIRMIFNLRPDGIYFEPKEKVEQEKVSSTTENVDEIIMIEKSGYFGLWKQRFENVIKHFGCM